MTEIPPHIQGNDALSGRFKVRLAEALSVRLTESDWKKFSTLHGLDQFVTDHHRFLRALHWGDEDFEGLVLDLVNHLYERKQDALVELFRRDAIQKWFKKNDPEFLEIWQGKPDPLVEALSHAIEELGNLDDIIDLREHRQRIQAALPLDPSNAIGSTKDMLEATMRTILRTRGHGHVEKLDYPTLSTACFNELGLRPQVPPSSQDEKYVRKIVSSAKSMVDAANELRNSAGTGHGRVVGEETSVSPDDASLVASAGLVLAAWLIRQSSR